MGKYYKTFKKRKDCSIIKVILTGCRDKLLKIEIQKKATAN
jgi:hypothetical protein